MQRFLIALPALLLLACSRGSNELDLVPSAAVIDAAAVAAQLAPLRPEAVDAAVWSDLSKALLQGLESREASLIDHRQLGDLFDLRLGLVDGQWRATWSHRGPRGDYDLNGEVSAADLVPLATNFGVRHYQVGSEVWWSSLSRIDGDENQEINAADAVVIGANFGRAHLEYEVQEAADPQGPWTMVGQISASQAKSQPGEILPLLSLPVTPKSAHYYRVVAYGTGITAETLSSTSNIVRHFSGEPDHGWKMASGNAQRQARGEATGPDSAALRWRHYHPLGMQGGSQPVLGSDGRFYVVNTAGLAAFQPDGQPAWVLGSGKGWTLDINLRNVLVGAGNQLYCLAHIPHSDVGALLAVRADGSLNWQKQIERTYGPPAIDAAGRIYVHTRSGAACFDTNGEEVWRFGSGIAGGPGGIALGLDGTVYYVHDKGSGASSYVAQPTLYALSPEGALLWELPIDEISYGNSGLTPAVRPDGVIILAGRSSGALAVNPVGTKLWHVPADVVGHIRSQPAIDADNNVFLAGGGDYGKLYCIGPDGSLSWTHDPGSGPGNRFELRSPVVDAVGNVYFSDWDERLYCVRADGTLSWKVEPILAPDEWGGGVSYIEGLALGADGALYQFCQHEIRCFASDGQVLPAPPQFSASRGSSNSYVRLSIVPAAGATRQRIYRNGELIDEIGPDTEYRDYTVPDSKQYGYQIASVGFLGEGERSVTHVGSIAPSTGGPASPADWAMHGGGPQLRRSVSAIVPDNPQILWRRKLGDGCSAPVFAADGRIYVMAWENVAHKLESRLMALSPAGTTLWEYGKGSDTATPALGQDGTIYVGMNGIVALTPDREVKWTYAEVAGRCTVGDDGLIYASDHSGNAVALKPDGEPAWTTFLTEGNPYDHRITMSPPTVHGGKACFTLIQSILSSHLYIIDETGQTTYERSMGMGWITPVTVSMDGLFLLPILSAQGALEASNAAGEAQWSLPHPGGSFGPAVAPSGDVYFVKSGNLHSYVQGGQLRWTRQYSVPLNGQIALDGAQRAIVLDNTGRVICINSSGKALWLADTMLESSISWGSSDLSIGPSGTVYIASKGEIVAVGR